MYRPSPLNCHGSHTTLVPGQFVQPCTGLEVPHRLNKPGKIGQWPGGKRAFMHKVRGGNNARNSANDYAYQAERRKKQP